MSVLEADIRPTLKDSMTDAERHTRVNLAAAFRTAYRLGWNNVVINHITARIPDAPTHFLMNPRGLGWHEITASSLVKADLDGTILSDLGDRKLGPAGFNFHSAILRANPHLNCVIHVHAAAGAIVSAMEEGLTIVEQTVTGAQLYGDVAYHDFKGYAEEEEEGRQIVADLGDKPVLIMRNHGLLTVGRSIGEAVIFMRRLVDSCELQVRLMATGAQIRQMPKDVVELTHRQIAKKRTDPGYCEEEWKMHLRVADSLDPSYRD